MSPIQPASISSSPAQGVESQAPTSKVEASNQNTLLKSTPFLSENLDISKLPWYLIIADAGSSVLLYLNKLLNQSSINGKPTIYYESPAIPIFLLSYLITTASSHANVILDESSRTNIQIGCSICTDLVLRKLLTVPKNKFHSSILPTCTNAGKSGLLYLPFIATRECLYNKGLDIQKSCNNFTQGYISMLLVSGVAANIPDTIIGIIATSNSPKKIKEIPTYTRNLLQTIQTNFSPNFIRSLPGRLGSTIVTANIVEVWKYFTPSLSDD